MLQNDEAKWFCIECSKKTFAFSSLNKVEFFCTSQGKKLKFLTKTKKRLTNEVKLINQLNDAMNSSYLPNPSTYYSIDKFNESFKSNSLNGTNLLHLNISFLPYNYEQLHTLLADTDINFDIIDITETRLRTGQEALNNIDIEKYIIEHSTTDANCGGALLYIKEGMTYRIRNELKITKSKELESIFIEIQNNQKQKNVIVVAFIDIHMCIQLNLMIYISKTSLIHQHLKIKIYL